MKHINTPKEIDTFNKFLKLLEETPFDDQSHPDNKIEVISISTALKPEGIKEIRNQFWKIKRQPLTDAVEELIYQIDYLIGLSTKQEKDFRKIFNLFLKENR
jgi:hypothetical protein